MTDAVKRACEQWISAGYGEDCFWEYWPECPCEDSLTPNQVMAAVAKLEAENQRLREALRECEAEIDRYIWQEYPLDHPVHERYRQRDFVANPARAALSSTGEKG